MGPAALILSVTKGCVPASTEDSPSGRALAAVDAPLTDDLTAVFHQARLQARRRCIESKLESNILEEHPQRRRMGKAKDSQNCLHKMCWGEVGQNEDWGLSKYCGCGPK